MPAKDLANTIASKNRKVLYDDYSKTFYFESKLESAQRITSIKSKEVNTKNRSELVELEQIKKQLGYEWHINEMKKSREMVELRESLRGHIAHSNALNDVLENGEQSKLGSNPNLGRYGMNTSRDDLTVGIDKELKQMTGEARRRKEAKRLLEKRRGMEVMDRNIPTEDIFQNRKVKASTSLPCICSNGELSRHAVQEDGDWSQPHPTSAAHHSAELVLPPIVVNKSQKNKHRSKLTRKKSMSNNDLMRTVAQDKPGIDDTKRSSNSSFLPSIFVTDKTQKTF